MFVKCAGSPDSPAVVFLHGGPLSGKMWQPVVELLPDLYCTAVDMPGHGKSKDETFSLKKAANATAEWIRGNIPSGKAVIVGHSLGGAVTLTMLKETPEVIERALVSGTAAGLSRWLGKFGILTAGALRMYKPQTLVKMTLQQMYVPAAYYPLVEDDLLLSADVEYNKLIFNELMEMELPAAISSPLLVCVGSKETPAAKAAARKMLALYPQAEGIVVQGLAHMWMMQNPPLFADMLKAWLQGKPMPAGIERQ